RSGPQAGGRQHQQGLGVDEAARRHGPLEGGAGVVGGVGEEFGAGGGGTVGSRQGDGPAEPRREGRVGGRPRAAQTLATGQRELRFAVVGQRRAGQQQSGLAAAGQ